MAQAFNVWEGIYASFDEVSGERAAFESDRWLQSQCAPFSNVPGVDEGRPDASGFLKMRDYALAAIVATMLEDRDRIRILDFGGGAGSRLLEVLGSVPAPDRVQAVVVDNAAVCDKGNAYFRNMAGIRFAPDLPEEAERFDIVHCGSSLHYVEDWFGMVRRLCAHGPRYLLFSDLLVGDIPTFVTAQNYYGERIPVWMWNRREFTGKLGTIGLELIFECPYVACIRGRYGPLPMENMPASHRLEHTRHALFSFRREAR